VTPAAGFLWGLAVGLSVGVAAIYVWQFTGEPLAGWALLGAALALRVRFGRALRQRLGERE
jgi:hypothetical protein